jgi:pseudouridine-5'-monophosphatase
MRNVCQKYGKPFDWETKVKIMGTTGNVTAQMICKLLDLPISSEQFIQEVEEEYPKLFPETQLMPGVERLLNHLTQHKIPIAIASSSKRKWYEIKTAKFGDRFSNYFNHILLAPEEPRVKNCKPAPDTFLVCREMFSSNGHPLPPVSSFLVFEDSVSGALAGVRAGMQVVWIPDPRMDVEAMKEKEPELKPTTVLSSMEDFQPEVFGLPSFHD